MLPPLVSSLHPFANWVGKYKTKLTILAWISSTDMGTKKRAHQMIEEKSAWHEKNIRTKWWTISTTKVTTISGSVMHRAKKMCFCLDIERQRKKNNTMTVLRLQNVISVVIQLSSNVVPLFSVSLLSHCSKFSLCLHFPRHLINRIILSRYGMTIVLDDWVYARAYVCERVRLKLSVLWCISFEIISCCLTLDCLG